MYNEVFYLSLFSKKIGVFVYWISILLLLIGVFMFFAGGGVLYGLISFIVLLLFAISWALLTFVKVEDNKIIIQSIFFEDSIFDLGTLRSIKSYLPFTSIQKIELSNGKSFFFSPRSDDKAMQKLKKIGLLK